VLDLNQSSGLRWPRVRSIARRTTHLSDESRGSGKQVRMVTQRNTPTIAVRAWIAGGPILTSHATATATDTLTATVHRRVGGRPRHQLFGTARHHARVMHQGLRGTPEAVFITKSMTGVGVSGSRLA
jgi:hypothetical protein